MSSMFWDMSRSLFHLWRHTDSGADQVLLQEKIQEEIIHISSVVSGVAVLLLIVLQESALGASMRLREEQV